jgi:hypothetical protein
MEPKQKKFYTDSPKQIAVSVNTSMYIYPINQCIFFCTFLIRMGREVLPLDKDYILDILDDVFFYIKQGSTSHPK